MNTGFEGFTERNRTYIVEENVMFTSIFLASIRNKSPVKSETMIIDYYR